MTLPIYTIDLETDPFLEGRFPMPFASGFFDGYHFTHYWGDQCLDPLKTLIETQPPGIIYAHNGGRFDIYYIMDWIAGNPMRVINSRIIEAEMPCMWQEAGETVVGKHSLRDSYAILPFALGSFKGSTQKLNIEIGKLERDRREEHREEIVEYLKRDCTLLWELCSAFHEKFGDKLTIGSTAMKELKRFHKFKNLEPSWDAFIRGGRDAQDHRKLRQGYYYGGRVEYFGETGVHEGDWKIYDINSSYPYSMKTARHPLGHVSRISKTIGPNTCFVKVKGRNYGAFPLRVKGGGLSFCQKYGVFHISIHEYKTARQLGLFKTDQVLLAVDFDEQGSFEEFVDTYYGARLKAKADNDAVNEMFYKLVLNSAYGKFSQNPDRYEDNVVCRAGWQNAPGDQCDCQLQDCECGKWSVKEMSTLHEDEGRNYWVWRRNSEDNSRFNVATGASITGFSRSLLMEAIHLSTRPVYVDTDCVICENLPMALDGTKLGDWKLEAQGTHLAIGGKKLYALLDTVPERIEKAVEIAAAKSKRVEWVDLGGVTPALCVKKANKGVVVTAQEIVEVARGGEVVSRRDAPSFSLSGQYRFLNRVVRAT
jgi:hypothetical protein